MFIVYVDDILITNNGMVVIVHIKAFLKTHHTIWDLGVPKWFIGIEFANWQGQLVLNQQKYILDLLH